MRTIVLSLILCSCCMMAGAQEESFKHISDDCSIMKRTSSASISHPDRNISDEKVFDVVEHMPVFPGGSTALMQYLVNNIHYPEVAEKNGIQGRVVVRFIVDKDGTVLHPTVTKSVHPALDAEAIRVVSSMPKWTPGTQNDQVVCVKYYVPVTFRLQ